LDNPTDRTRALARVPVSRETERLFDQLIGLLVRWQRVKNLVGPATLASVWTRHLADSAQLPALVPHALRWVDLGSGAGFPGLVIAILLRDREGAQVHCVEANSRKCAFLREVARTLSLPVMVHDGRIEDVLPTLAGPVDVVTARALAPLADLLSLTSGLLTTGTLGLFPKGQDVGDELTQASKCWTFEASTVASKTDPKARIVLVESLGARIATG
jgi:16S rRNA (guanine527-N7)-methyltransferase